MYLCFYLDVDYDPLTFPPCMFEHAPGNDAGSAVARLCRPCVGFATDHSSVVRHHVFVENEMVELLAINRHKKIKVLTTNTAIA